MHRQWRIQRTEVPYREGQDRWDRVYQCLLHWAQDVHSQEEDHVRRPVGYRPSASSKRRRLSSKSNGYKPMPPIKAGRWRKRISSGMMGIVAVA
jgi:hypothetical protein